MSLTPSINKIAISFNGYQDTPSDMPITNFEINYMITGNDCYEHTIICPASDTEYDILELESNTDYTVVMVSLTDDPKLVSNEKSDSTPTCKQT